VFASSALREKSAIMFKCIPSILEAGEIISEFSSICTVALQKYSVLPNT